MIRKIIKIDEAACNGCGLCAKACHEGAIAMVEGKARLIREDYCDGLGDCLPACPVNAISFEEREAAAYDEAAVQKSRRKLNNWPVQIKLVSANAPWLKGAELLIAADCTAYAYRDFHKDLMENRMTLIGCPKLDGVNYADKLSGIIAGNDIRSITVVRMEVPCCCGLEYAVNQAIKSSGKRIPWQVITVSAEGEIID